MKTGPLRNKARQIVSGLARVEGLAAIEFAFLTPILMMLTICTVDLGIAAYDAMQVENGAQAGSEYAAVHGFNVASISNVVTQTANIAGLSASPAPTEFCACPSAGGNSLTTVSCGSNCTDGTLAGTYVTVSASATYTTLIHYPMLPASFNFVNAATARIN